MKVTRIQMALALTASTLAGAAIAAEPVLPAPATPPSQQQQPSAPPAPIRQNRDGSIEAGDRDNGLKVDPQAGKASGSLSTGPQQFGSLDADGSGMLTPDEIKGAAGLKTTFAGMDANNDGKLDQQEFAAGFNAKPNSKNGNRDRTRDRLTSG